MTPTGDRTDVPVLMLYNLDLSWDARDIDEVVNEAELLTAAMQEVGHPVIPVAICDTDLFAPLRPYGQDEYIILNWCEGLPGVPHSYAQVAWTIESLGFAYTGSTAEVLALSEDKHQVKKLLDLCGIPSPRWQIYESAQLDGWDQFPAIVKPALEHCSFGVTTEAVVMDRRELRRRIEYVLDEFHQPALVEDFVDGREFHVWLWGNGKIDLLPVAEMDFCAFSDVRDRLCTYDSKFDPQSAHYNEIKLRLPAPLGEDEYRRLDQVARATYRAMGCRDYARLDIRMRDGEFYVLDVNPNPDITSESSLSLAANLAGYSYGAVGSHLVNLAAHRHPLFSPAG